MGNWEALGRNSRLRDGEKGGKVKFPTQFSRNFGNVTQSCFFIAGEFLQLCHFITRKWLRGVQSLFGAEMGNTAGVAKSQGSKSHQVEKTKEKEEKVKGRIG